MNDPRSAVLVTRDGRRGTILTPPSDDASSLLVQMDNGRQLIVPRELIQDEGDGKYWAPLNVSELERQSNLKDNQVLVIPLLSEELRVEKRQIEKSRVRIHKKVSEREELVDESLVSEEVSVQRVPVNEYVEDLPTPWYDGDTLVIPVLEEVLVVEKKVMLREEIRVSKVQREIGKPQRVTLRKEEAIIERISPEGTAGERQQNEVEEI